MNTSRYLVILFICPLIFVSITSSAIDDVGDCDKSMSITSDNLVDSVNELNKMSHDTIGVGLAGVSMLFQAGPNSFLLEEALGPVEMSGIAELQRAGYVTRDSIVTAEGKFVRIAPTEKGRALLMALGK